MRVLIATDQWFPDMHGGSARVATEASRALAARGHEVVVLAPEHGGEPVEHDDGVTVHRVLRRGILPQTFTDPVRTRQSARRLASKDFDVLLAHQATTAVGLRKSGLGAPLVLLYHASAERELRFLRTQLPSGFTKLSTYALAPALGRLERRAVSVADRIMVLSDFSRSLLEADHDVEADRIRQVVGGVDTDRFSPGDKRQARLALGLPSDARLLFTVRRLEARMGLDRLLHALPSVGDDVTLAVAGTGNMGDELAALAEDLGLEDRVRFLGRVSDDELVGWYRAADLAVLPTVAYEGFGMMTAEALACGTPVVGTAVGATPELLGPIDPTLLIGSAEPAELAEGIERGLATAADESLRVRCREHAVERFSWPVAAAEWEGVLHDATRSRAGWKAPEVQRAGARIGPHPGRTDLLVVAGARPNFMKAASVVHAAERAGLSYALVHTGQHYDRELSQVFLDELGLPKPDVYLGVGSASHAEQTARIMLTFEKELLRIDPSVVVVVGDVNSTLACALVAVKEAYPVAHVEAGLRCGDERMAEEINRKLCDHVADHLFTTSRDADNNLIAEGVAPERISFVGNTMIDTLLRFAESARARDIASRLGVAPGGYAVATLHRPENVDSPEILSGLVEALVRLAADIPIVLPIHPRTGDRLQRFGLDAALRETQKIVISQPLGYLDFIGLLADSLLVLTDSGGIQEEATVLGIPCLTLRDSTERPVTVEMGTNRVVGRSPDLVVAAARGVLRGSGRPVGIPELWDGRAGERIVAFLAERLYENEEAASANA